MTIAIASDARLTVSHIALDAIRVGSRHRVASDVSELVASIRRSGLLHPITVREAQNPNGFTLVAGANRLAAYKILGLGTIPAFVRTYDDLDAELAEIDENLTTNVLTVLEQGEHLVRRSEILREQGLRARPEDGATVRDASPDSVAGGDRPVTTADIAEQIGKSDRSVQRYVEIANELPSGVRDLIRGSEVANRTTDLLTLAKMNESEQLEVARYIESHRQAGVAVACHALFGETAERSGGDTVDDPGDDVGERYDIAVFVGKLKWKKASSVMRKRIINGEERFYPRESTPAEYPMEYPIGVECFEDGQAGRLFLANSLARQVFTDDKLVWPPL